VGAGRGGWRAGPRLSGLPTRPARVGRRHGQMRGLRQHPAVGHARERGMPGMWPHRGHGRLAQLGRASPLQGEGRGFESLSAHEDLTTSRPGTGRSTGVPRADVASDPRGRRAGGGALVLGDAGHRAVFRSEDVGPPAGHIGFRIGAAESELGLTDRKLAPNGMAAAPVARSRTGRSTMSARPSTGWSRSEREPLQRPTELSKGFTIASVVDPFGNVLGLRFDPRFGENVASRSAPA
jgi:hypothetical protein